MRPASDRRDAGVSLVEVLVAMGLFGMVSTILLGMALGTSRVTDDTRRFSGINEESRLAMERFTRELRQAEEIKAFSTTPAGDVTLRFFTDFDGDGVEGTSASDPELLTYTWTAATKRLTLSGQGAGSAQVLSVAVSDFEVDLYSSLWEYDDDGDGLASWQELDAAGPPVGNANGAADAGEGLELERIDLVTVSMTVLDGPRAQTYRTQVTLRNRSQT